MEEAIILKNVSKEYKLYKKPQDRIKELLSFNKKCYHERFKALNNLSLTLKKGETLGVIGKNGAGKSTLLKLITGVTTPTTGEIKVDGNISALLELGTGFNPEYNGYENIYLNGTMRGFSKNQMDEKLDEIIKFADIGEYINQPVKTYSSGMFARLAFAVMISFKPDILIVDEALSVGDVFFQQKCNTYMKEEMKDVSKILVTHDMASIANMADRVILIDKGEIIQEGEPLEVIENYLKIMHSEVYRTKDAQEETYDTEEIKVEGGEWVEVPKDDIGGAGEINIISYKMKVNNKFANVVKYNDLVEISYLIHSKKQSESIVCGYVFKDKYGNSIFGQNTAGSNIKVKNLNASSTYKVTKQFHWPKVKEGDYFLTLGIGEGEDQMVHVIQCWAHNIVHINVIALEPMHGIINHSIESFEIKKLGGKL